MFKKLAILEVVESGWRAHFAAVLKVARSSLYSVPTRQVERDELAVIELKAVNEANPYYGVARLAIELGWTEKKARRIRNLSDVVVVKRSKKRKSSPVTAEVVAPDNALRAYADFKNPDRPQDGFSCSRMVESGAWVQDFTYIYFLGMWVYVATVLDLKTRRIVGWSMGLRHNTRASAYGHIGCTQQVPIT